MVCKPVRQQFYFAALGFQENAFQSACRFRSSDVLTLKTLRIETAKTWDWRNSTLGGVIPGALRPVGLLGQILCNFLLRRILATSAIMQETYA